MQVERKFQSSKVSLPITPEKAPRSPEEDPERRPEAGARVLDARPLRRLLPWGRNPNPRPGIGWPGGRVGGLRGPGRARLPGARLREWRGAARGADRERRECPVPDVRADAGAAARLPVGG